MQVTKGIVSSTYTYTYVVGSNTPGDYQIPAIEVTVEGRKYSTQALKLEVLARSAAPKASPKAE